MLSHSNAEKSAPGLYESLYSSIKGIFGNVVGEHVRNHGTGQDTASTKEDDRSMAQNGSGNRQNDDLPMEVDSSCTQNQEGSDDADETVSSEDDDEGSTDGMDSTDSDISWIKWYCSLPGHHVVLQVPEEYIEDEFNLTDLDTMVPMYSQAIDMILDYEVQETDSIQMTVVEQSARTLYALIHQRYILTKQGMNEILERLIDGVYGTCPRTLCGGSIVIPCGTTDLYGNDTVKVFCTRCMDIYVPRENWKNLDGAFFGTTFPHLFAMVHPNIESPLSALVQKKDKEGKVSCEKWDESDKEIEDMDRDGSESGVVVLPAYRIYDMKIFGFRVHSSAEAGPRSQWLRYREGMPNAQLVKDRLTKNGFF